MLAIVAPGQGSQSPGFLTPWLGQKNVRQSLELWSEAIGLDLVHLGTEAGADEIRATENAQPLIVGAGLIAMKALGEVNFSVTAGHSVGELTSAAISGVISDHDAMLLVRERGLAMAVAAAQSPTGMSAVLGGERENVLAMIASLGLIAANENGGGQIVAAGDLGALTTLAENPPQGARVRALAVAGAFHTPVMKPALDHLREFASRLTTFNPVVAILSNSDGATVSSGRQVLDQIVNQIVNPVRWDLCMQAMGELGVTAVIELPPAGTLVGLIKRALPNVEALALKTPEDLLAAKDLISRHCINVGVQ